MTKLRRPFLHAHERSRSSQGSKYHFLFIYLPFFTYLRYIANVIYTIVGEAFATWVHRQVDARHKRVREEEGMIELDPEIAAIYQRSTAVSKLVGNSHNLMKSKYPSGIGQNALIHLYYL